MGSSVRPKNDIVRRTTGKASRVFSSIDIIFFEACGTEESRPVAPSPPKPPTPEGELVASGERRVLCNPRYVEPPRGSHPPLAPKRGPGQLSNSLAFPVRSRTLSVEMSGDSMKGNSAAPGDQTTSKPTRSNASRCSTPSAFFVAVSTTRLHATVTEGGSVLCRPRPFLGGPARSDRSHTFQGGRHARSEPQGR